MRITESQLRRIVRQEIESLTESIDKVPNSKVSTPVLRHLLARRMGVEGLSRKELVSAAEMTWGNGVDPDVVKSAERKIKLSR